MVKLWGFSDIQRWKKEEGERCIKLSGRTWEMRDVQPVDLERKK
jgi:hypothetical protein